VEGRIRKVPRKCDIFTDYLNDPLIF